VHPEVREPALDVVIGSPSQSADLVFTGGNIQTLVDTGSPARALAVANGVIMAVDKSVAALEAFIGPSTRIVELAGRTLLPGFVDPHTHFGMTTFEPIAVDCNMPPIRNRQGAIDAIAAAAAAAPPGRWILGLGYSARQMDPPEDLTRADLDAAAPHNPVCVVDHSVHSSYANTAAMRLAGITAQDEIDGGAVVLDESGQPAGTLWERALNRVYALCVSGLAEAYGETALADLVRQNGQRHLAYGITSVGDAAVTPEAAAMYRVAAQHDAIPLTLHEMRTGHGFLAPPHPDEQAELLDVPLPPRLRGGTMKMFMDPVFPRNAGYQIHADGRKEQLGRPYYQQEDANLLAAEGARRGLQVAIHCLGTWAIDLAMNSIEEAIRNSTRQDPRHRLEHFTSPTRSQISRVASLEATVVTQPSFFFQGGEKSVARLRDAGVDAPPMPVRTMLNEGVKLAMSSDFPCGPLQPLYGIHSLVSRHTRGYLEPVAADESISVLEALRLYTIAGARAMHRDDEVGTLEVGKRADLVVLSHDPAAVDPGQIREIVVEQTYVDGERVYDLFGRD
jgi:predicted amidohydrolase YtcJ